MKIYLSAWVVPVSSPPIERGAVAVEGDEIAAVGTAEEILARWGGAAEGPLGDAVLLPGLTNAHTHLELGWMAAAPPPRGDFLSWVQGMIDRRTPPEEEIAAGIERGVAALRASGTAVVGDVGNTPAAMGALLASGLAGRFFLELAGERTTDPALRLADAERRLRDAEDSFRRSALDAGRLRADHPSADHPSAGRPSSGRTSAGRPDAGRLDPSPCGSGSGAGSSAAAFACSIVPHGPHSVALPLLRAIAERARRRGEIVSLHLAESRAEDDLLRGGSGPFRTLLDEQGALEDGWRAPGRSPAQVADEAGLLGPRTLAVHGVHLSREDARLIAGRGATLALCPRSNAWTGAGTAPVRLLLEAGVRIALGTDSLASNDDLDLLAELAALRRLAPDVPPEALLRAATLSGAEALGVADSFGSLEAGKRAALVALRRLEGGGGGPSPDPASPDPEPYATLFAGPARIIAERIGF